MREQFLELFINSYNSTVLWSSGMILA
ncbi:hypothetical protein M3J09_003024 [Ascochyta lentis]